MRFNMLYNTNPWLGDTVLQGEMRHSQLGITDPLLNFPINDLDMMVWLYDHDLFKIKGSREQAHEWIEL